MLLVGKASTFNQCKGMWVGLHLNVRKFTILLLLLLVAELPHVPYTCIYTFWEGHVESLGPTLVFLVVHTHFRKLILAVLWRVGWKKDVWTQINGTT